MKKLLQGVKILDLTRVLSGPYASMILSDLGAEVIKVELPNKGDESRAFGPFYQGESMYFGSINRGKKSITIDLRKPEGQKIVQNLAGKCDVLIENFRPGRMKQYNLDFETLYTKHPHLIYASISGFGQTGPYAQRPAYDLIIQAMSGIVSITGEPEGKPVRVGSSIADLNAALFSVIGILAALKETKETGKGQHVDVSMLDCQIALLENALSRYFVSDQVPKPLGSRHSSVTPFQFFKAVDGHIVIAVGNDKIWKILCETLNLNHLSEDSRFITNDLRTKNHPELEIFLNKSLEEKTVKEWCDILEQQGIPCSPIYDIAKVVEDPHINHREMIKTVNHQNTGPVKLANSPLKFSETPLNINQPWPTLGEHTKVVLQEMLGLSLEELDLLKDKEVI